MLCPVLGRGGAAGLRGLSGGSCSLLPGFAVVLALTQGPSAQQPQLTQCHGAAPEAGSGPGGLRVRAWPWVSQVGDGWVASTSSHCQLRQIPSKGGRRRRAWGWAWHEVHLRCPRCPPSRPQRNIPFRGQPRQGGSPGLQCRLGSYTAPMPQPAPSLDGLSVPPGLGPPPRSPGGTARPGARWSDSVVLPSTGHPSQWHQVIALNSR